MVDINKIAAIARIAQNIQTAGLILTGGYKALAALFGHDLTPEEQTAITVSVRADALRRREESRLMSMPPEGE
jgi:hypothetical protein